MQTGFSVLLVPGLYSIMQTPMHACPDPALSWAKGLVTKPELVGLLKCWSLVILSVELQIGQCWKMNLIASSCNILFLPPCSKAFCFPVFDCLHDQKLRIWCTWALEPSTNKSYKQFYSYIISAGLWFCFLQWLLLYASLFQCLGYGETITNFPSDTNQSWTIFLQFPLLSFLDTERRGILLRNIAELADRGSNSSNISLSGFNESMICVGRYEAYRLSYYEES